MTTPEHILVVTHDKLVSLTLTKATRNWGFAATEAADVTQSLDFFDSHNPVVTLLDIKLSNDAELNTLRAIKKRSPDTIVIIISDKIPTEAVVSAFRAGADDVIEKPINLEELQTAIHKAIESKDLRQPDSRKCHKNTTDSFGFEQIIGKSPAIIETISLARKIAASDVSCVLLQGESGTGKDLFAKAIHYSSDRADKPFVSINCAAIPPNLLVSELFGYEKGAFTDAKVRKEGLFEQAEGGTIFLDEIGELELGLQAKLLRILEEKAFRRVGGLRDLPLNVHFIAASNRNLKTEVKEKRFREDLYYRLSIIQLELPPLHQRTEDILLLANYFVGNLDKKGTRPRKFAPEVLEAFRRHRWRGNVRELRNVIERALILEDNQIITMKYMPEEIQHGSQSDTKNLPDEMLKASIYFTLPSDGISLDMVEKWLISEALTRSGGNVTRAGKILRVSRDRIRYSLRKNKIHPN